MKAPNSLYFVAAALLVGFLPSCIKVLQDQTGTKQITAFTLELPNGTPIDSTQDSVYIGSDSIYITLDSGINRSHLIPIITTTGALLVPASGNPENFTDPVTYTVTAQDGTSQSYIVVVKQ
jgi:hypothetical protein